MTRPDSPAGTVDFDGDFATLRYVRHLPHSPERVWRALTTPEELRRWFMAEVRLEPRAGGRIEMIAGVARFEVSGTILAWEPPRLFEYEWRVAPRAELPQGERESVVRWELEPVDGGTRLTVEHRRLTRPTALGFAPGMHVFLDRLAAALDDRPLPGWQERYGQVARNYPSWTPPGAPSSPE